MKYAFLNLYVSPKFKNKVRVMAKKYTDGKMVELIRQAVHALEEQKKEMKNGNQKHRDKTH